MFNLNKVKATRDIIKSSNFISFLIALGWQITTKIPLYNSKQVESPSSVINLFANMIPYMKKYNNLL